MNPSAYFVMAIGTVLVVAGVVLFIKRGTEGRNVVKMLDFEFQFEGSALVILVLGVVVLLMPFFYPDSFRRTYDERDTPPPLVSQPTAKSPVAPRSTRPSSPLPLEAPSANRDVVRKRIREIVASQFRLKISEVTDSSRYDSDLGADDLDLVELLMALEKEFKIEIPDSDFGKLKTVGATIAYIVQHMEPRKPQ